MEAQALLSSSPRPEAQALLSFASNFTAPVLHTAYTAHIQYSTYPFTPPQLKEFREIQKGLPPSPTVGPHGANASAGDPASLDLCFSKKGPSLTARQNQAEIGLQRIPPPTTNF